MSPPGLWGRGGEAPLGPSPPSPAAAGPARDRRVPCSCVPPPCGGHGARYQPTPAARPGSLAVVVQSTVEVSVTLKYLGVLRSRRPALSRGDFLSLRNRLVPLRIGPRRSRSSRSQRCRPSLTSSRRGSCRLGVAGSPARQRRPHLDAFHRYSLDEFLVILATCRWY